MQLVLQLLHEGVVDNRLAGESTALQRANCIQFFRFGEQPGPGAYNGQ